MYVAMRARLCDEGEDRLSFSAGANLPPVLPVPEVRASVDEEEQGYD